MYVYVYVYVINQGLKQRKLKSSYDSNFIIIYLSQINNKRVAEFYNTVIL